MERLATCTRVGVRASTSPTCCGPEPGDGGRRGVPRLVRHPHAAEPEPGSGEPRSIRTTMDADSRTSCRRFACRRSCCSRSDQRGPAEFFAGHVAGAELAGAAGRCAASTRGSTTTRRAHDGRCEAFVGGSSDEQTDRILSTLLFTDIVDSTEKQACSATGAGASSSTPSRDRARRARPLARCGAGHGGRRLLREVRRPGTSDGVRADSSSASASSASRSAWAAYRRVRGDRREVRRSHGLDRRQGRIERRAGEVLVSRTVKDLVAGSGLTFEDRGEHELKGVPDRWHLYRVVDRGSPGNRRSDRR